MLPSYTSLDRGFKLLEANVLKPLVLFFRKAAVPARVVLLNVMALFSICNSHVLVLDPLHFRVEIPYRLDFRFPLLLKLKNSRSLLARLPNGKLKLQVYPGRCNRQKVSSVSISLLNLVMLCSG